MGPATGGTELRQRTLFETEGNSDGKAKDIDPGPGHESNRSPEAAGGEWDEFTEPPAGWFGPDDYGPQDGPSGERID
jgi:hypothetical protein